MNFLGFIFGSPLDLKNVPFFQVDLQPENQTQKFLNKKYLNQEN